MTPNPERREHYRLRFPQRERPCLLAGEHAFEVIEISEGGARIEHSAESAALMDGSANVLIRFRDGTEVDTTAASLRTEADELVVAFGRPIPLRVIYAEQRRLLSRYPRSSLRSPSAGEKG